MERILLSEEEVKDRIYGCWMGKNIGGTLGGPFEGKKWVNCLKYYHRVPDRAEANDDLDLQLLWLEMLEERGLNPSLKDFAEYWKKFTEPYPWNEYGFGVKNLARGLVPPVSGCFENHYIDEMGSPIRSEIWACIAPGNPQLAASMAWKDSSVDHAGGEGTHGEMFWAAVESAAFVTDNPLSLIDIGLGMIPYHSEISRAIREVVWCFRNGISWAEARQRILDAYGRLNNPCNAIQNHGFTIIGWLYGKDFGEKICTAVNCGFDTDCTGSTLGALLGILKGRKGIPKKWIEPIGEKIVLFGKVPTVANPPVDIKELTERTFSLTKEFTGKMSDSVEITSGKTRRHRDCLSLLSRNELALKYLHYDPMSAVERAGDVDIWFHYNGAPVLQKGISKTVGISIEKNGERVQCKIFLKAPEGWKVRESEGKFGQKQFDLYAKKTEARNRIEVVLKDFDGKGAVFTILGQEEAKGYPANTQVGMFP